jgi:hypothetical protein
MREAELFDGTVLEFPDETPDEVIFRTVKAQTAQKRGLGDASAFMPPADITGGFGERADRETIAPETPELRREIDRSKAVAGYEALPEWQKPLRAASDALSVVGAGLTFGMSDRLAALAAGTSVEEEQAKTQAARDRAGWAGTVGEIAGSVASIPARGLGLASRAFSAAPTLRTAAAGAPLAERAGVSAANLGTRAGVGATRAGSLAAEGAIIGGAGAAGYGNDINEGMRLGAAFGLGGQAAGKVAGKVVNTFGPKAALSSIDDIRTAKNAAYDRSEAANVIVKKDKINEMADEIEGMLTEKAWTPERVPAVAGLLRRLGEYRNTDVTLKGIDSLRQIAGNLGGTQDDLQNYLSRQLVKKIDKHIDTLDMTHVVPGVGNKTEAVSSLRDGIRLNRTMRKAETIQEAVDKAERLAAGQNTSFHKALQTQMRGIMNSKTRKRGFSKDELAAIDKIARGNFTQSTLGWVSALAPTNKLNIMLQATGLATTGGASLLPQIGLSAVGGAAQLATKITDRNSVYGLARLIRQNGLTPHLQAQIRKMPPAKQARLTRVLQGWGVGGAEVPE